MNPPTAIVMLNMGGPAALAEVQPYLREIFADRELIRLPFQRILGPLVAALRAPKVRARYAQIGGGSPILHWTRLQGEGMARRLDLLSPQTAPHKFYVAFRYAAPRAATVLAQMKADGVKRAVAFSQYPHFSCSTSGASLNDLWRALHESGLEGAFRWSVIDRWFNDPGYITAVAETVRRGLEFFPAEERDHALLLFSAHSLPLKVVDRGDPYPQEVGACVQAVIEALALPNPYLLGYQSGAGPVRWLGPETGAVIAGLGRRKQGAVLAVPISFTSDHIETLYEIDRHYRPLALLSGIQRFERAPALNDSALFIDALARLVKGHLQSGEPYSRQYRLRCPGCSNPACREIVNPVDSQDAAAHSAAAS